MAVYSWASPLLSDFSGLRMRRITWPVIRGSVGHIWNPRPTLPIHYSTFRGLRWRLRVVYSWTSPLLSSFRPKIFKVPPKSVPKMAVFRKNGGLNIIFYFQNPKRHIIAWDRVCILREDQFWGLGCTSLKNQKNEHLGVIFHAYGEKKSLAGSAQNFALGRYPERNHRCKLV